MPKQNISLKIFSNSNLFLFGLILNTFALIVSITMLINNL